MRSQTTALAGDLKDEAAEALRRQELLEIHAGKTDAELMGDLIDGYRLLSEATVDLFVTRQRVLNMPRVVDDFGVLLSAATSRFAGDELVRDGLALCQEHDERF